MLCGTVYRDEPSYVMPKAMNAGVYGAVRCSAEWT